jgi:hypothetical protein
MRSSCGSRHDSRSERRAPAAEAPPLARKGHQTLEPAAVTADPGDAMGWAPTPKVGRELPRHEPREPWSAFLPRRASDEGFEMGLDGAIED